MKIVRQFDFNNGFWYVCVCMSIFHVSASGSSRFLSIKIVAREVFLLILAIFVSSSFLYVSNSHFNPTPLSLYIENYRGDIKMLFKHSICMSDFMRERERGRQIIPNSVFYWFWLGKFRQHSTKRNRKMSFENYCNKYNQSFWIFQFTC